MAKTKKQPPEKWENQGQNERFIRLHIGLLESDAYLSLKPRQMVLYSYMKLQYKGKENKNRPKEQFEFSWSKANKIYKLYTNKNYFYDDINALITSGFIDCIENNKNLRKSNVYAFSDRWKST